MKDVQFMSAKEKEMVLKQWRTFLKRGCQWEHFTKRLYDHLTLHCSFIAHYNRLGFYDYYFNAGSQREKFFSQFDISEGGVSVEIGMTYWRTCSDYGDINMAMCQEFAKYKRELLRAARHDEVESAENNLRAAQARFDNVKKHYDFLG